MSDTSNASKSDLNARHRPASHFALMTKYTVTFLEFLLPQTPRPPHASVHGSLRSSRFHQIQSLRTCASKYQANECLHLTKPKPCRRDSPFRDLRDNIALEFACTHHRLLASKLVKKTSTNLGAIHLLQHETGTQPIGLPLTNFGGCRPDGPEVGHASTFKMNYSSGTDQPCCRYQRCSHNIRPRHELPWRLCGS